MACVRAYGNAPGESEEQMAVGVHQALEDAQFDFVLAHVDGPVLAYFWGVWSAGCKELDPVVRDLAAEYAGRLTVVRTDLVRCPATTKRYGVTGAPTVVLLRAGQVVETATAPLTESDLRALVSRHVPSAG
ncbi:thioredoxin family protein [Streptomyces sp. NPDC086023]|uniref:thioredoxin family protein n=1 Tax=Streptomyces sp. NPDC086023 TaxID=3365746 RepID=UPI0037D2EA96